MRALPDHRDGRPRGWLDRLRGGASEAGASILRSRLFLKYVALFVAVVSLALVANGVFDVYFSYQEQKSSLIRIQREQAESAASKIAQFIGEIESQVGWTTQLPWSAGTLEQRRFDALRLLRQVPAITELAEIDSSGHEQLRVSRLAMEVVGSGTDVSKEPAFTEAVAHKVYYGAVYFRRESEPYMTLSLAGTRRDTGVSIAQVNLKLIWDVLSRIKFAGHGRAYVVDAAGRLIAHPDISLVLRNTDMSKLAQVRSARAQITGGDAEQVREADDIEGHRALTASAPVLPLKWLVFVETPIEEAYAPLYASIERTGLVLLGALALAFAAGMFLARRMVVPIQALRSGAARLGSGDLSQRIAIKTGDEVETLADQFNDMAGRLQESYANLEQKVEQRTQELTESLEQQTATSEVLRVISSSPGDLKPVFDAILANAVHICGARFGNMSLVEGDGFHMVAMHNAPREYEELRTSNPMIPLEHSPLRPLLRTKQTVHIADLAADPAYANSGIVKKARARAVLCVPMLKEDDLLGALVLYRMEPEPFTDKQTELLTSFARQAVIAIENARLLNELRESLAQQTAMSEVLDVISRSAFDLDAVFEKVVERSARLSGVDRAQANIFRFDGELLRVAATFNVPPKVREWLEQHPIRPGRHSGTARAALERRTIHVPDVLADPEYTFGATAIESYRTILAVPILKADDLLGVLLIYLLEVKPFTDKQIALVETFADQAAIAIENVRLFEAEQQRTRELAESLEQQTATAEVLHVISSSPGDLEPVFATMLEKALRICDAKFGSIYRWDGEAYHLAATQSTSAEFADLRKRAPLRPHPKSPFGRMVTEKTAIHVADTATDPSYIERAPEAVSGVEIGGARTLLAVPMLKENELIGAITVFRQEQRPFTEKQIALITNFAAQAVIAIENARLLTELRESLAQQTASADVLRVISGSQGDLKPVFESILANAVRLCDAEFGNLPLVEGNGMRMGVMYNAPAEFEKLRTSNPVIPLDRSPLGVLYRTKEMVHIPDLVADPSHSNSLIVTVARARAILCVPLLKDEELIGALVIYRQDPIAFTDKQIAILTNFAAQAVIAIENARLLNELRRRTTDLTESLEQQTATAEVLRVISSSPGDLEPVFGAMLENAVRICGAKFGAVYRVDGDMMCLVSTHNAPPAYEAARRPTPFRPGPKHFFRRMIETKTGFQSADAAAEQGYIERRPEMVAAVELGGVRTYLVVPMLRDNELVGAFLVGRQEVRPFTDKQIALITSFASQAVIAIENTRLLTELHERTDELGRSVGELRALGEVSQAVNSTLDLETVLSTIVAKAVQLSNTDAGAIYVFDEADREFQLRATYGMDGELIEALSQRHIGLNETNVAAALSRHDPIQIADLRNEPPNPINEITLRAGYRARLTAPLIRGADIVGMLVVRRRTPGAFPQNTVDLIKTFAAQSVLAIQNARLFHEIEDKSQQLEIAGRHKSQFLANMSHELRTPLNAIIGYSEILQEDAADTGQAGLVPDLKKIEGAGRHLLGLINDILDLSKIEAGRMEVFLEQVEIVPLLDEVRAIIVPLAEKKGNVLEFRLAENLGSMRTDRTKLKQSLLNILSNGSKFTENGKLILTAERFSEAGAPMLRFAIADTGIGMNDEQLGRLFQAFSQADASTTKKYGGTGLGLAISRRFCQILGGDITVTSKPGEGSTFTIVLPDQSEAPAEIKPAEAPRISAEAGSGATVLIVDDDPAARDLLAASLKPAGYRVVQAANGAEALDLARSIRPDAITLDVMMPKPDGWEVLNALKADAELGDIPVVMVTIVADRGIGLSLGAVDVLTKPVDRARLTQLIHRLVRRDGPVLVVEDDADAREMMRHTIERMSLSAAEAEDGRAALAWLGEHPLPALILLDLMMPHMDGFEFLDALGAREQWRDIPVIVITAKKLTQAERERLLRQARKVMEKATATRVDIAAAINEAFRRRRQNENER